MRTSRIATVLLALAPTAIIGSPVPIPKDSIITSDHGLTPSKTTNHGHGLADRDDHNPPTPTDVHPGDLCINAHATEICTPGGEDNPNFNQNTKRSKPDDSVNLEATVVEAAAKVEARDDTDPNVWNCSYTSLRQYQCTGGPDNETCVFDDGREVLCTTSSQKTAALRTKTRDGGDPDFTCIIDARGVVICDGKTAALQTETRDGGAPDFTCVTDVRGVYVCTGPDVRCVIGKQGDATCTFNGPDGSDGDASKFKVNEERLAGVLSKVAPKPKTDGTEDDSDPFDANPNYSCSQISDWTWSCGPNGVGPGSGNGKGKSLDTRDSDDEHYDPGQGCNQPQGFFGGCNGKRASNDKREVDEVPNLLSTRKANVSWYDVSCNYITDDNKLPYPSGFEDCRALQSAFLSPNNTLFIPDPDVHPASTNPDDFVLSWPTGSKDCKHGAYNTCHLSICNYAGRADGVDVPVKIAKAEIRENMRMVLDKCVGQQQVGGYVQVESFGATLVLGALDTTQSFENQGKYDPGQGCNQPQGFFGGCNGKRSSEQKREVDENTKLASAHEEDEKKDVNVEGPDAGHYDPGQGCNQPQGFFGGCNGKPATTKREEMFVKVVKKLAGDEKKDVSVGGSNAGHYDPGQGCNQPQGFFGGCNGKDASAEKRDVDEKLAVVEGDEKNANDGSQGWHPSCFFGGCNGSKEITKREEEIVEVSEKVAEENDKKDVGNGGPDENYDPGQGCNQPQGFFGGCNGK